MKKSLIRSILLILFCLTACGRDTVNTLTYAVYPYLPDAGYYEELIESRWAELEPDIRLVRADWDCYTDGEPEGIDVVMYDAVMRDTLVDAGWIQPIEENAVWESSDVFPFALEGLTVDDKLYGIPVFMCGNFLIYDEGSEALASAEHITDLADLSDILVVNAEDSSNRPQYIIEVLADARGEANPSVDGSEECMELIDRLAIDAYKQDDDAGIAAVYDSGIGQGYIGFSESMRLLKDRADVTRIKAISFSDRENIPRLYTDAAAVTSGTEGVRRENCLELMNVMAEASLLSELSVQNGDPQYLLLARRSPYRELSAHFPIYSKLEELAADEKNQVILTP